MTYPDGTLLKSSDQPPVWLIQGGQKHWIPSPDIFNADGFSWSAILVVSDAEIASIPQGPDVPLYTTWITPGPEDVVFPGQSPSPPVQYGGFAYKRWMSGGGGHLIYGRAQFVTQTGVISGETVTINAVMFAGYHSGTSAIITNSNGIAVYTSDVFRVGVNARGFGPDQIVPTAWSFNVPMDLADQAAGFAIMLSDSPDNLKQILDKSLGALIQDLVPLVSAIGGLFGGSKKPGSPSGQTTTSPAVLSQSWGGGSSSASPV